MSQRILITGAARGIGAGAARKLAEQGHRLALLGLEGPELEAVAASCHPRATAYEVDVTDHDELDATIERAVGELGGLDVVIANAGIGSGGLVDGMDPDLWEKVVAVNLVGVYRTVRACLPHLKASRGYVLPVASLAAVAHAPLMSAYAASKAGVEAFANSLRVEVAHHGVAVGCAYFSWIDTDMVRGTDEHPSFTAMLSSLKGPFGKRYPLHHAVDAIVAGVEGRKRLVAGPKWVRFTLPVRSLIVPLGEAQAKTKMPEVERLWEQEVAEIGLAAASSPTGAGGKAAVR